MTLDIKCPLCNYQIWSAPGLENHLRNHHTDLGRRGRFDIMTQVRKDLGWPERKIWKK